MAPMARGGPTVGIVLTIPTADNLRFEDTPATEAGLSSGDSQIAKAYHGYIWVQRRTQYIDDLRLSDRPGKQGTARSLLLEQYTQVLRTRMMGSSVRVKALIC